MRIIRGKYGHRRFDPPRNITARPTTDFAKENLFNVIENLTDTEGLEVLDLFAGTGAISFEFLSRGAASVIAVEMAQTQAGFIRKVQETLGDDHLTLIRGDVFKFIATCRKKFDLIFADPPYDHKDFDRLPGLILDSEMVREGTIVIIEHSKNRDFSYRPEFLQQRVYGSVNFSIFRKGGKKNDASGDTDEQILKR
ncbi:MAG: methyltransferase domain-containing protein [Bacteroides sp.]|nr:methyltransferase domain-containing protein [Bacteroides sp.]